MSTITLCTDRIVCNHPHYERSRVFLSFSFFLISFSEEIRNRTLVKLTIKGTVLNDTRLLLIEPSQPPSKPSVELVRRVLEKTLSARSHRVPEL